MNVSADSDDILLNQDTLSLQIKNDNTICGVNVSDRTRWIEILRSYKGKAIRDYEQIIGTTYNLISLNPPGTILNIKIHFVKQGFTDIITNDVNVQLGINTPQNKAILQ